MNNRRKQLMLASAKEYCKCVVEGKTLKYNQIVKNGNFNGTSEWTSSAGTFSVSDNICSFDATAQNGDIRTIVYYDIVVGHKYLVYAEIKTTTATNNGVALYFGYSSPDRIVYVPSNTEWNKVCGIKEATAQGNSYLVFIRDFRASDRDTIYIKNVMCIDLTKLGLDTITNTSDFFETDLGKYVAKGNYLPYEPNGKFIHAQSPINFKGVNIWNEQYRGGCYDTTNGDYNSSSSDYEICSKDKIRVKPNTKYYVYCGKVEIGNFAVFYDKNNNFLGYCYYVSNNAEYCIITPDNAYYMNITFGTEYGNTYLNDICINEYNENYNGKYYKYCGNSVFESGLTLYKGDKYKTYGIDEINYNNLIPNANQDYVNSDTDSANANAIVYGANGGSYWAENLTSLGFYSGTFESNTTELVNIYMSGNNTNLYFATDIQTTSGHKYYISFNVLQNDASIVGGLRIANLRLIDLTQLGLSALTDKLRIFLQKNYKLPYTTTNKTIKDQIVRTFKEVDLSSLTWTYNTYINAWQSDLSSLFVKSYASNVLPSAIAEKYRTIKYSNFSSAVEGDMWLFSAKPVLEIKSSDSVNAPSGKALLELETPEIITDYPMDFVLSNDNLSYDDSIFGNNGTIFALPNGLIPVLENGIPKLEIIGDEIGFVGIEYGNTPYPSQEDVYYANGFRMSENQIAFTTTNNDGSNVTNTDERVYLVGKTLRIWVTTPRDIPDIMVSRRTINVESENEIDLDFTKE